MILSLYWPDCCKTWRGQLFSSLLQCFHSDMLSYTSCLQEGLDKVGNVVNFPLGMHNNLINYAVALT